MQCVWFIFNYLPSESIVSISDWTSAISSLSPWKNKRNSVNSYIWSERCHMVVNCMRGWLPKVATLFSPPDQWLTHLMFQYTMYCKTICTTCNYTKGYFFQLLLITKLNFHTNWYKKKLTHYFKIIFKICWDLNHTKTTSFLRFFSRSSIFHQWNAIALVFF